MSLPPHIKSRNTNKHLGRSAQVAEGFIYFMEKNSTFNDLPISAGMKRTLNEIGFASATPIQEKSIPHLLEGRDLLGQAQTGTGKTAAFSIPLIEKVDTKKKEIQALVVCPTRELCLQVAKEIERLATHTTGVSVVALYGGQAIDQQFRALRSQKPQIVVATPGRLFDHLRRGSIELSSVVMITLDEADEMLDMGFREEIEQIFDLLPEENQRIFFSATMPKAILDLVHTYLKDPIIIKTESKNLTVSKIDQSYFKVRGREKTELLCRLIDFHDPRLAVVFCNAKSTADEIVDEIKFRGFEAGVLHGDLSQNQRDKVMAKFRAGHIKVLVATDIAARGIDVDDVDLVVNYHLPHDPEDYVHRIGRTGRAGRAGRAVSLVEPRDNARLRKITFFAKANIDEKEPPSISDVKAVKLSSLFGKVQTALSSEMIGEYRSFLKKQSITPEDMAAGLIKIALEKFDEHAMNDDVLSEIRGRKYSGMGDAARRNDRERRGGGGFSDRSNNDRGRRRGPREGRGFDDRFFAPRPEGRGRPFEDRQEQRSMRKKPEFEGARSERFERDAPRKSGRDFEARGGKRDDRSGPRFADKKEGGFRDRKPFERAGGRDTKPKGDGFKKSFGGARPAKKDRRR